jgi:hypothetical protein
MSKLFLVLAVLVNAEFFIGLTGAVTLRHVGGAWAVFVVLAIAEYIWYRISMSAFKKERQRMSDEFRGRKRQRERP